MNIFDQIYDLSSPGPIQLGVPHAAQGYVIIFEPDANGASAGNVQLFLGAGSGSYSSRLCYVAAGKMRTGSISKRNQTAFTLTKSTGAQGLVRIKFTDEPQPEAAFTL